MTQANAQPQTYNETFIPEKSDFEKLLEKDFKPETVTERFLLQRDMYWWQAERFFASGMYKKKFNSVELVFAAMMYGLRFGWHPITSLDNLYPVNDKMTPSTQSMLGLAQSSPGGLTMKIIESDGACEVYIKRGATGMEMTTKWTKEDADTAGLTGKDNWKKYQKAMLRWRAIADNLRIVFADRLSGVLTTEEAQGGDFDKIPGSDNPKVNSNYEAAKAAQNTGGDSRQVTSPARAGEKPVESSPIKPAGEDAPSGNAGVKSSDGSNAAHIDKLVTSSPAQTTPDLAPGAQAPTPPTPGAAAPPPSAPGSGRPRRSTNPLTAPPAPANAAAEALAVADLHEKAAEADAKLPPDMQDHQAGDGTGSSPEDAPSPATPAKRTKAQQAAHESALAWSQGTPIATLIQKLKGISIGSPRQKEIWTLAKEEAQFSGLVSEADEAMQRTLAYTYAYFDMTTPKA